MDTLIKSSLCLLAVILYGCASEQKTGYPITTIDPTSLMGKTLQDPVVQNFIKTHSFKRRDQSTFDISYAPFLATLHFEEDRLTHLHMMPGLHKISLPLNAEWNYTPEQLIKAIDIPRVECSGGTLRVRFSKYCFNKDGIYYQFLFEGEELWNVRIRAH